MNIRKLFFAAIFLGILLTGCSLFGDTKYEGDFSYKVEDFSYTNQDGETVSLDDLKGSFWVADMVFTSCNTVCPPMTANMARLQKLLKEEGLDEVRLVSFSVDPEVDTPEMLKEFGDKFGADYSNWDFLTGYTMEEAEKFALKSFKSLVDKPEGQDQVNHTVRFFIVTPDGNAIKSYDGRQAEQMQQIVDDLKGYLK
ncbi:protein SCO1/2 [Melghiribacillus thermohalophilus]|uniref:Protein SCO1/2 n=1 Tax=Melghiribacillus thermohalophilus TaxID=1324956 RepID=A0A4R3MRD4_9BACI|nr:SCO family protein [Melghiribacillus thermohalophilus]TCT18060.1 protein SCO1/2 [Melghiribacillus thermohalophilus]